MSEQAAKEPAPPEAPRDVHAAVAAVYAEVGYVHKGGKVDGASGGYHFASEADILAKLRPAMVRAGLTVHVVSYEDVAFGSYPTKSGGTMHTCSCLATVRFTHPASGTFFDVQALGFGADSGDKHPPKAQTIAFKYALRNTFALETGDDPDKDVSVEEAPRTHQERGNGAGVPSGASRAPSVPTGASAAPGSGAPSAVPPCDICGGPGKANPARERNEKAPPYRCAGTCTDDAVDSKGVHYPHGYSPATAAQMKAVMAAWTQLSGKIAHQFGLSAEDATERLRKWLVSWGLPESRKEWMRGHAGRFLDAEKSGWLEERLLGAMETDSGAGGATRQPGEDDVPF